MIWVVGHLLPLLPMHAIWYFAGARGWRLALSGFFAGWAFASGIAVALTLIDPDTFPAGAVMAVVLVSLPVWTMLCAVIAGIVTRQK